MLVCPFYLWGRLTLKRLRHVVFVGAKRDVLSVVSVKESILQFHILRWHPGFLMLSVGPVDMKKLDFFFVFAQGTSPVLIFVEAKRDVLNDVSVKAFCSSTICVDTQVPLCYLWGRLTWKNMRKCCFWRRKTLSFDCKFAWKASRHRICQKIIFGC